MLLTRCLFYRYEDRVLITSQSFRSILAKATYVSKDLLRCCEAEAPWLLPILELNADLHIPAVWKTFLKDIASSTSALALVMAPLESITLLKSLLSSEITAEMLAGLNNYVPTMYKVLRHDAGLIGVLKPVIERIISKIEHILKYTQHRLPPSLPLAKNDHLLLPSLPVLTERGDYTMDKTKAPVCTKNAPKHNSLTPGIFTVNCMHGKLFSI